MGRPDETVDLPAGARVDVVLDRYGKQFPRFAAMRSGIGRLANDEFARVDRLLGGGG